MFYSFRSSFHAETCESPTLSGVVTAPISENLMADVLSFLTMRQGVLCQSCATGLNVFRSKQRTGKKKQSDERVWCNHFTFGRETEFKNTLVPR